MRANGSRVSSLESRVTEEASALAALGDGKRARGHKRGCRTDERKRKRRKRDRSSHAESEERRELVIAYYF